MHQPKGRSTVGVKRAWWTAGGVTQPGHRVVLSYPVDSLTKLKLR